MARIALGFHKHVGPFLYYLVLVRFMASGQQNATTLTTTEEGVRRSTILAQNGPASPSTVHSTSPASGVSEPSSPVNAHDHRRPCGSPDLNCDKDLNGKRVAFPGDCRRFFICAFRFTEDTGTAGKWRWTEKWCPEQLSDTPYLFEINNPLALDGDCVQRRTRTCRQVTGGCVLVPYRGYETKVVKLPEPSTTTSMSDITTPNLVPAQEEGALAPGVVAGAVIGGVVVTIVLVELVCRCSRGHSMSSCRRQKKERVKSGGNVDMNDPIYQDSDMLQTPFLKQTQDIHNAQLDEKEKDLSQLYSRPIKGDAKRPTTESIVIKENSLYSPSEAEPIYLVETLPKITEETRAPNPYEEVEPLSKIPETTVHYDDVPVETDSDTASASLQLENPSRDQKNLPHNYEEVNLNIRNSDENQERSKSEKSHYYVLENPAECAHYKT
ncbi:uncharacterized protein LOC106162079 [Lingula anatina]|uniref:Uncharacterized protein LOC106162079 n=1 Tax=Lingula anatina TaxID=7574 RepID=A0A1S3IB75_LINAN|nr:uncharacterized protein LOC106162079 [Lingula anatina]|eukprot:XP_013394659.1 uncharacterized protein LOC106162079 [Lingula anatina]